MGKSVYALVWPIATGLAYYAAAVAALALTKGHDGIAAVWPSSGVLVAALLLCRREAWPIQLIAAAVASLVANLGLGNSVGASLGFTLANVAESFICAWLLMRNNAERPFTGCFADIASFFLMASLSTFVSASLASLFAPNQSPVFWFSWFSTDLLGILLVTPLILILGWSLKRGRLLPRHQTIGQIAGMLALVVAVSAFTFSQSKFPLLFLPMLTILAAVFRLGVLGAAGGVLIVAIVSSAAITMHSGPEALIDADPMTRSLFLQFYLLSLFAASLPIAVLLGARRRLVKQISENIRLLQLAETVANVGHWRLDLTTQAISWSPEVFKIHGMHDARPPAYDAAIDAYHPDDQGLVQAKLADAIDHHRGFEFRARIVRPGGQIRHVLSRGEFDRGTSGRPLALFGVIQDITSQVEYEEELRAAAERAARAADEAQILAETDQLTGIANRRRVTLFLEQAIADAQTSNSELSIAVLDIDHFKAINDRYGHMAGDLVIQRVATDASHQLRGDDMLGRFGGEEFVIVFPQANAHIAMIVAERVRKAVEASRSNPTVTISTGIAQWARGETSSSLLRRADEALYAAKRSGRNVLRLSA